MARKLASVLVVALIGTPLSATALGLGELDSDSGLNEPLSARIPLLSIRDNDAASIRVSLASPAAFERAGLERPFYLSRLKFEVKQANEQYYILVSTEEPFKEPFLDFLLNVRWPQGDLQREYTVLLNPPRYSAGTSSDPMQSSGASASWTQSQSGASAPPHSSTQVVVAGKREIGGGGGASKVTRYGPVRANQTLWGIASKVRPYGGVTVYQTMQAILQDNPEAFIGGDINVLMKGSVLRVPSREAIARIDANEAARQMQKQLARWQKQQSSGNSKVPPAATSTQATANAAETAPAGARPSPEGRLHVVAADEDVAAQATASLADQALEPTQQNILQLQQRLAAVEERNISLKSANAQLQQQTNLLRKKLIDLQLSAGARPSIAEPTANRAPTPSATEQEIAADLPSETALASGSEIPPSTALETADGGRIGQDEAKNAAAAQSEPITAENPAAGSSARSGAHGSQLTTAATPASKAQSSTAAADPHANPAPQQDSPSLKTRLLAYLPQNAWQLVLLVSSPLLILLLLWAVHRRRRRGAAERPREFSPAALASTGGEALTAVKLDKAAANHGRANTQPPAATAMAESTVVDEAEGYIAYGRYEQAQELLDRALGEHPDSQALRLKLLEVLAAQGDRSGFEAEAQVLHTQVADESDPYWQRTIELARQIAPDHPLFSNAIPPDAGITTVQSEKEGNTATEAAADSMPKPMPQALETELDLSAGELPLDLSASLDKEGRHQANGREESTVLEFDLGEIETFMSQQVKENAAPAFPQDSADEDDWGSLDFSLPQNRPAPSENRKGNGADNDQDALRSDAFSLQSGELDLDGASVAEPDGTVSLDEVGTKLDLARAYLDMGDAVGAKSLLNEVVTEGNAAQQGEAQDLLQQVG